MEQQLLQAVHELKEFHDNFLKTNDGKGVPNTLDSRNTAVRGKSEEIFERIETELNNQNSDARKSTLLLLKGKLAQLQSTAHCKSAADALQKAVKLDPTYIEAWNELGEAYWRNGDALQAKSCFEHAVKHSEMENVDSLCKLSMILRQVPYQSNDEHAKALLRSLDLARKAIKLDINNGHAWYTLGNAHLNIGASDIRQAIAAYKKAEDVDDRQKYNPDLHFNKGQLLMFQCNFSAALHEFRTALSIDSNWSEAEDKIKVIESNLRSLASQISSKGKLKARRLAQLRQKLKNPENTRCGVVISSTSPNEHLLAFSAVCLMPDEGFVVVKLNCSACDSVKIGDTLEFAKEVEVLKADTVIEGEEIKFNYVFIRTPHKELLVNNRRMNSNGDVGLKSAAPK